jgi:hypothetical protein
LKTVGKRSVLNTLWKNSSKESMLLNRDGQSMLAVSLRLASENATLKRSGCPGTGTIQKMNY